MKLCKQRITMILGFSLFVLGGPLSAKDIGGCFQATQSCEAYQSFRKETNPGNVRLQPQKQYRVLEKNTRMNTYRIHIDGVERPARWVKRRCGDWLNSCTLAGEQVTNKRAKKKQKGQAYLLALTWQPSFCEDRPYKKECRKQTQNRYDSTHWSLHGLWPQPRNNTYCGVSEADKGIDRNKRWHLLAPPKLSHKTAKDLAFTMPGMQSNLHRHEWIKHGTCYGKDANTYYADSIYLTKQVNDSVVGALFNRNIGKKLSSQDVRRRFDQAFGRGAGKKVNMRCDRKGLISELWINLQGDISDKPPVGELLKNAVDARSSCREGRVDRANK